MIFAHPCVIVAYSQQLKGGRSQVSINSESINEMWSVHRMDYFALKRKQIVIYEQRG